MNKKKNKHPEIPIRKNTLRILPLLVALTLAPTAPYVFATTVDSDFVNTSCNGGSGPCNLNSSTGSPYTVNGDANAAGQVIDTTADFNVTGAGVSLTVTGYNSVNPSGDGVTITTSGFEQAASAGKVTASGNDGKGMNVTGGFTAGSSVQATGNSGGIGINTDTYTQAGGALTATGNVGKGVVTSGTFSQTGGDVSAAGDGGGTGVQAASYQISAGSIVGSAGAAGSIGLDITGDFTHTAGTVMGASRLNSSGGIGIQIGGNYTQAAGHIETINIAGIGIKVNGNFTQNGGTIFADASENMSGVGIHIVGELSQGQNGTIMTMGGVGPNTYGTYVGKTATIDGTLISRRDENSSGIASMYVANSGTAATALTFGANAVYQPEFTPAANAGGLVVAKGDISITSGARIAPQLTNTIGLADGTSGSVTVLKADGGTINGDFANTAVNNGSLKYSATKGADSYTVDWSYTSPATVFESTPGVNAGPNTLALLRSFERVNPTNAQTLAALNTMSDAVANVYSFVRL